MAAALYIIYAAMGILGAQLVASRLPGARERQLVLASAVMHVVFAALMVVVTDKVLGGGDMFWYHRAGSELAELVRSDWGQWGPEVWKLTWRQQATFPFWVHGAAGDSATGAMFGISAWVMLASAGSLYVGCLLVALAGFAGKLAMALALRSMLPEAARLPLLAAVLLLPSTVFWTSGLLKEAVAVAGFGWVVAGSARAVRDGYVMPSSLAMIVLGALPAYLVKPYILFPFVGALAIWYVAERLRRAGSSVAVLLSPTYLIVGGGLAFFLLALLSNLMPSYSLDSLGEELAQVQYSGTRVTGTSNYSIVDTEDAASRSLAGQLVYAPLGLLFALFRPFLFEVRNAQMLVNSLETTLLTVLLVLALRRYGLRALVATLVRQPALLAALAYTLAFGTFVGLASTNIGTLSRYRIPMMPFYAMVVFVVPALTRAAGGSLATVTGGAVASVAARRLVPVRGVPRRVLLRTAGRGAPRADGAPTAPPAEVPGSSRRRPPAGGRGPRRARPGQGASVAVPSRAQATAAARRRSPATAGPPHSTVTSMAAASAPAASVAAGRRAARRRR